jgi:hypothetical protein
VLFALHTLASRRLAGLLDYAPYSKHFMWNIFARVTRFLFWLLIVSWSAWALRRIVGWLLRDVVAGTPQAEDSASPQEASAARRLVRDPICGVHVDETLSIPYREGGEIRHFCSTACRDVYIGSVRKLAANA